MLKATIQNLQGDVTNWVVGSSEEELMAWAVERESEGSFQLTDREVVTPIGDGSMESETTVVPATHTMTITDETAAIAAMVESNEARRYLRSTDWYIVREMDSGEPCPQDIKTARALARTKVTNS